MASEDRRASGGSHWSSKVSTESSGEVKVKIISGADPIIKVISLELWHEHDPRADWHSPKAHRTKRLDLIQGPKPGQGMRAHMETFLKPHGCNAFNCICGAKDCKKVSVLSLDNIQKHGRFTFSPDSRLSSSMQNSLCSPDSQKYNTPGSRSQSLLTPESQQGLSPAHVSNMYGAQPRSSSASFPAPASPPPLPKLSEVQQALASVPTPTSAKRARPDNFISYDESPSPKAYRGTSPTSPRSPLMSPRSLSPRARTFHRDHASPRSLSPRDYPTRSVSPPRVKEDRSLLPKSQIPSKDRLDGHRICYDCLEPGMWIELYDRARERRVRCKVLEKGGATYEHGKTLGDRVFIRPEGADVQGERKYVLKADFDARDVRISNKPFEKFTAPLHITVSQQAYWNNKNDELPQVLPCCRGGCTNGFVRIRSTTDAAQIDGISNVNLDGTFFYLQTLFSF